jgi:pimeloyl-ACP methyl ester carboxylesterase
VASKAKDVSFLILMAGPGTDGKNLTLSQLQRIWKAEGHVDGFISLGSRYFERLLSTIAASKNADAARPKIKTIIRMATEEAKTKFPKEFDQTSWSIWFNEEYYLSDWWRYYLRFDPKPNLREVGCPVLAINGDKDLWVPSDIHWPVIARDLKEGKNPEFTTKLFPGLNHLFQTCETGLAEEYAFIPETISPRALEYVTEWIESHTGHNEADSQHP